MTTFNKVENGFFIISETEQKKREAAEKLDLVERRQAKQEKEQLQYLVDLDFRLALIELGL